jgi:plastocyanin
MTTVVTTMEAPPTTAPAPETTVTTAAPTATPSTPGTVNVTLQDYAFSPASLTVPAGTTVTWTNKDPMAHTILNDFSPLYSAGGLFSSGQLLQGQQFSFTFEYPGTYPYHCSLHSFMTGTITVT